MLKSYWIVVRGGWSWLTLQPSAQIPAPRYLHLFCRYSTVRRGCRADPSPPASSTRYAIYPARPWMAALPSPHGPFLVAPPACALPQRSCLAQPKPPPFPCPGRPRAPHRRPVIGRRLRNQLNVLFTSPSSRLPLVPSSSLVSCHRLSTLAGPPSQPIRDSNFRLCSPPALP